MLKIVLYSYMNHNYSSRAMESSCKRDVNFMYLLEGSPAPDHSTFAKFRSLHFAECAETIMAEMTNFLYEIGEVLGNDIFIDGTKIEAYANKYTFVWKKSVSKNLERLLSKLADFVAECEEMYGLKLVYENKVKIKHVNYIYIKENMQLSFIKPANYEISKTKKYKNDISRIENMEYDEFGDYYTCKNNKKLIVNKIIFWQRVFC